MSQLPKTEQVIKQMIQYKNNILALYEVRWTGMGQKRIDKDHSIIYSGNDTRDQGVSLLLTHVPVKAMICWTPISSRIITARFPGYYAKLSVVARYASTNDMTTPRYASTHQQRISRVSTMNK
ncbi:hypothetical protein QYM36_005716 [Artemia franciscana]|uniref:Uncharacterized protein n=1 Tax=Artemia franciscana TaxID=6661 RepID=A0AA88HUV6_ARTSF|nr:hypothetical protein QYM36_005716 [Artemia franciscana]